MLLERYGKQKMINVDKIINLHIKTIGKWHQNKKVRVHDNFLNLVLKQHKFNYEIWHEEDKARRRDVSDHFIANIKRKIDKLNQRRNDYIEKIDEEFIKRFRNCLKEDAEMNSETVGNIIDRLSVLSLRIYHMEEQTQRADADKNHIKDCEEKLKVLKIQRRDLTNCLQKLIMDIKAGKKKIKIYRQFKMYNDPKLNPELYMAQKKNNINISNI